MYIINSANPNSALGKGLALLAEHGTAGPSRNGPVISMPAPVTTITRYPHERVMFSALRDANPFFHLAEALWMLAGRNDVALPAMYAKQLELYSDDGATLNGAYGFRWREHFGYDQLLVAIDELRTQSTSRRVVISMWDGSADLPAAITGSKDVPCNTHIYFSVVDARRPGAQLDMTVCCRSNDAVWGAHGANVVHFSFLQEFVARCIDVQLGYMYQFSNNYHVYTEREDVARLKAGEGYISDDRYQQGLYDGTPWYTPVIDGYTQIGAWTEQVNNMLDAALRGELALFELPASAAKFLRVTALPMLRAHHLYKLNLHHEARDMVLTVEARDWQTAGIEWFRRRKNWSGDAA